MNRDHTSTDWDAFYKLHQPITLEDEPITTPQIAMSWAGLLAVAIVLVLASAGVGVIVAACVGVMK